MNLDSCLIKWLKMTSTNLKGATFEQLTESFRGPFIRGIVTHLDILEGSVLILLSPLGKVFGNLSYSEPLYWNRHDRVDWGNDVDRNRAYARELRRAGIRKTDPQAKLFGNFDRECGKQSGSIRSLSVGKLYLENYRVRSYGFERGYETAAKEHLERLFAQLNEWVFVSFQEDEPVQDFHASGYSFDYWLMNWAHPTYGFSTENSSEDASQALAEGVLEELKRSVGRLEAGLPFDLPEAPICQIKRPVHMHCRPEWARPLSAEVLSYRSRLVRLRAAPWYFRGVESALPDLRKDWPVLAAGRDFPYDPLAELEAYLREMLARFPVIGEDPFAAAP